MEGIWTNPTIVQRECKCRKTGCCVGSSSKRRCPLVCVSYVYMCVHVCMLCLRMDTFLHIIPIHTFVFACHIFAQMLFCILCLWKVVEKPHSIGYHGYHGRRKLGSSGGMFMFNSLSFIYLTFCQGVNTIRHVCYSATELGKKKKSEAETLKLFLVRDMCYLFPRSPNFCCILVIE